MSTNRTGLWIIGAWGGVATTAATGLLNLQRSAISTVGLTTELPMFARTNLPEWAEFVVGGHEIRQGSFRESAEELARQKAIDPAAIERVKDDLDALDARVLPGFLAGSGSVVEKMADRWRDDVSSAKDMIDAIQADLRAFAQDNDLAHVIVVNLMSTEPVCSYFDNGILAQLSQEEREKRLEEWTRWEAFSQLLRSAAPPVVSASTLYAAAALELGCDFINFTPSLGATPPAFEELAKLKNARFMGNDGKTGETLMKSVLAPMFAHRNLNVMSWVGHNIFGNRDGVVLDDPRNKATKVASKNHLLTQILGYEPQTLVSIEYIKSLGDWKTAWDHIHFEGFLGTPMTLQFTWQGCDSLLAAPLVLDLARLTELARRKNFKGKMDFLACFFKSPIGVDEQGFVRQFEQLERWIHAMEE
ncbi:MAG: inositol-3-phosphate synthase [Planctomycetia bacterium]|nr:inositol-3-phosphate synthase [Planctomycetia bacterium]